MKKTGLLVSILLVAAFVLTAGCTEYSEVDTNTTRIAWSVSVEGDNYYIEIVDVEPEDLDDVEWSIYNTNWIVENWEDPDGIDIRMEGDLDDINHSSTDYDNAAVKAYNTFYSRDPSGLDSRNHTLCVVFKDQDEDGKLSSGDNIWIRSVENDGAGDEDFRFRLVNDRVGKAYGERLLPAV